MYSKNQSEVRGKIEKIQLLNSSQREINMKISAARHVSSGFIPCFPPMRN
jgi:hypothetical protein